jgi:hypothetical protein
MVRVRIRRVRHVVLFTHLIRTPTHQPNHPTPHPTADLLFLFTENYHVTVPRPFNGKPVFIMNGSSNEGFWSISHLVQDGDWDVRTNVRSPNTLLCTRLRCLKRRDKHVSHHQALSTPLSTPALDPTLSPTLIPPPHLHPHLHPHLRPRPHPNPHTHLHPRPQGGFLEQSSVSTVKASNSDADGLTKAAHGAEYAAFITRC